MMVLWKLNYVYVVYVCGVEEVYIDDTTII